MSDNAESNEARAHKDYSSRLRKTDSFYAALHEQMISWLAPLPGSHILNAGCGAGGLTALLASALGDGGAVAALDLSPAHLAATRALLKRTPCGHVVSYHEGSAEALPFADGSFDLAW